MDARQVKLELVIKLCNDVNEAMDTLVTEGGVMGDWEYADVQHTATCGLMAFLVMIDRYRQEYRRPPVPEAEDGIRGQATPTDSYKGSKQ